MEFLRGKIRGYVNCDHEITDRNVSRKNELIKAVRTLSGDFFINIIVEDHLKIIIGTLFNRSLINLGNRGTIFVQKILMHCETLQTRKRIFTCVFFLWMITILPSCNKTSNFLGTYRIYSSDPAVQQWIVGENTYLKLNSDNTIIYNSTMNGKQRFHFEGHFTLDKSTNTITVQWKDGKLPDKLKIEESGSDYVIRIGTTTYKKENAGS